MRVLLASADSTSPIDYRIFVQRAQIEGLMADHLVAGEPYLAANAVVLDRDEAWVLQELTATFARVFHKAGALVMADRALMVEWGFPWVAAELLGVEIPRMPIVGRFDFACDRAGRWWLLELNADTPSGIREAIVVDEIAHEVLPGAKWLGRPNVDLAPRLTEAFTEAVNELVAGRPALGLITHTGELEDLAQMAYTQDLLRRPLGELGVDVVLGDADNLRATGRGLLLCGRPIGALYRYLAFESIWGTPVLAAMADASATGKTRLINGLFGLLLQHKGLLAWIWEHRDDVRFAADEREAICGYLPPTWMIFDQPEDVAMADVVAKQVFGREGAEVLFGEDMAPEVWEELRRRRTYVVQRRVEVVEHQAVVWTSHGPVVQSGHATVGSFAVNGQAAGYYTRFGGKIINSRAKWLATFVEQEGT